jgi:hypothetical protein
MIVALIVAALLIGTAAFVFVMGGEDKELTATITPDPVTVGAGDSVQVTVAAEWGGESLTGVAGVKYAWSVEPSSLGVFDMVAQRQVTLTAGNEGGEGTISCVVTYNEVNVTASVEVTVTPPVFESVVVTPSAKTLAPDQGFNFTAAAYDSVGGTVASATFTWTVEGLAVGEYTLSSTTGATVNFSASVEDVAWLNASATISGVTASSGALVTITSVTYTRTVDYYWYDMFAVPFEPWWELRSWDNGGTEEIISDEYPYLYVWKSGAKNTWTYTNMRLNVTARNLTEVNSVSTPFFYPILSDTVTGGNVVMDIHMDFATNEELEPYGSTVVNQNDGWLTVITGTLTMDETAAMAVLGMSQAEVDDFDTTWALRGAQITSDYEGWLLDQGQEVYDIYNMYEFDFMGLYWPVVMDAEKVGDEIVLNYDYVTWGMEALFAKWLRAAFVPTEWYYEDFYFTASVGPERSDIDITTAVEYAVYAYQTTLDGTPCWEWEALLQDVVESSWSHPISDYDPYVELTYLNNAPGSLLYGTMMDYDYTPGAHNLSEGETMTIVWPSGEQLFQQHVDLGVYLNVTGEMTIEYSEPAGTDFPGQVLLDTDARSLTFVGPIDMWTWSEEQTAHENLQSEWDRLGVLPYGQPTIEFKMIGEPVPTRFEVSNYTSPIMAGESSSFEVTVLDQFGKLIPDYVGTAVFSSNDSAAVFAPTSYTFTLADAGNHTFPAGTATFMTPGYHDLTVVDSVTPTIAGSQLLIEVIEPPHLDHFEVAGLTDPSIANDTVSDVTVTAIDQFGNVFDVYEGTVHFTSTDPEASLPADYPFVLADAGVHAFPASVMFAIAGDQTVSVEDASDATRTGSQTVTVTPEAAPTYFLVYGIGFTPVIDTPESVTVEVYDQYDRLYPDYDGTVTWATNRTGEVTLPIDYAFVPATDAGVHEFVDEVVFTSGGYFTVTASDSLDPLITGEQTDILVVTDVPHIDHFAVECVDSVWNMNYSDVTVTAYSQYDLVFDGYNGIAQFSTDATAGTYELPADYTFVPAVDNGVKSFPASLMFEDPGTYSVIVTDSVNTSATGQDDVVVVQRPVATTFALESDRTSVSVGTAFTVTLTVLDQHGAVFADYAGTVHFTTTDSAGVVPDDYTFVPGTDAGVHVFTGGCSFGTAGDWTITVVDIADGALTDSVDVSAVNEGFMESTYTAYDLFQEPFGEWWTLRSSLGTDYILNDEPGMHTMLFRPKRAATDPEKSQGIIYAPYRWNIDVTNLSAVNLDNPVFTEKYGPSDVPDASATFDIYFQYMSQAWWDNWWVPTWTGEAGFNEGSYPGANDGYYAGTVYNVTMNREGAYSLLNMPVGDDPATWWSSNKATFIANWETWIDSQANDIYDIYCGYESAYYLIGTWAKMTDLGGGQVMLTLGHWSWGYEVLMVRWLAAMGICPHEVWYEDFQMVTEMGNAMSNYTSDAVVQYQLHAVKANESAGTAGAWAFEPTNIDYITATGHPSDYAVYEPLMYTTWNAGDGWGDGVLGVQVLYENAPGQLNLDAHSKLVFQLPATDVIGYEGVGMTQDDYKYLVQSYDITPWEAIEHTGSISPGYDTFDIFSAGGGTVDYDPGTKTLTVTGPFDFDSTWDHASGLLYHGAPWVEFNVVWTKLASTAGEPASMAAHSEVAAEASAEVSTTSELASLVSVMCAVTLMTAALALSVGRRRVF